MVKFLFVSLLILFVFAFVYLSSFLKRRNGEDKEGKRQKGGDSSELFIYFPVLESYSTEDYIEGLLYTYISPK